MPIISSRQHVIVKQFRALARGDDTWLLLDGWHLLDEALDAGLHVDTVVLTASAGAREQSVLGRLAPGVRVVEVSPAVMNAVSPVRSPAGVVASARRPAVDAAAMLRARAPLLVAACGLQDPGNVGALVRSAAAAGATGVVIDMASADPWGWKALRASMGSAFRVPLARPDDLSAQLAAWSAAGVALVAAVPRGGTAMYDVDLARPTALLVGGEGPGLPDAVLDTVDDRVSIPMQAQVESLNAAVAAAVLLYEARRQRTREKAT